MRSKQVQPKVEKFLIAQPHLRDSDKELLLAYWQLEGLQLTDYQKLMFIQKCTPAESITRARRSLKEDYPASEKVTEGRYQRFQEEQSDHSKAVPWL